MTLRVGITGGGSGGHFYPLIAVVEELQQMAHEKGANLAVRYFGATGEFRDALLERDISISPILSSKLRRYFSPLNFVDMVKFVVSIFQALIKLFFFMPDVIFSKGGPGSLAVVLVGRVYRIPVIIHESDAVPGRTNSMSARFAARVAISFPQAAQYFTQRGITNVALTGNPVRRNLLESVPSQESAKQALGFNTTEPLMLVLGGSQGAERINAFIVQNLADITMLCQVFHQTGARQFEEVQRLTEGQTSKYKAAPFLGDELKIALSAADIVVARAGAGTIFEIAAFGKPSILIPIPEAIVGEHQKANAYGFADTGAAVVIEEENLLPSVFLGQVQKIISNQEACALMIEAAKKYFKPDSGKMIAEEIFRLAE